MHKVLIIGCPRSGTLYAARYFRRHFNLKLGHESFDRDGISAWMMAVEPKELSYPWGYCKPNANFEYILHQVRHPINAISSLHSIHRVSWAFIEDHIDFGSLSELAKRMKFWLEWNKICADRANLTYRVEDIDDFVPQISSIVGVEYIEADEEIDIKTNTRKHPMVNWSDLEAADQDLCDQVKRRTDFYGYKL